VGCHVGLHVALSAICCCCSALLALLSIAQNVEKLAGGSVAAGAAPALQMPNVGIYMLMCFATASYAQVLGQWVNMFNTVVDDRLMTFG
jgi:hypothetical protein